MMVEGSKINELNSSGREIKRIPTCMIEARSKDLVPIFDYLQTSKIHQTPKIQQTRNPALHCNTNKLQNLRSELSQTAGFQVEAALACLTLCLTVLLQWQNFTMLVRELNVMVLGR